MTLNIWNLGGDWRARRAEIVAWIAHLDPDVVCLQEVVERADGRNQARWLADATSRHAAYGSNLVGDGGSFGNAILSRWPIDEEHVTALTPLDAPTEGRCLLHARTAGIDVFCTHLNWQYDHGYVREAQVQEVTTAIAARAHASSPLPPILAGDLNANPDSNEIRYLCGLAALNGRSVFFQDAWRVAGGGGAGYTWDNRNSFAALDREPDGRIDYVLVGWRRDDGAGRVESARVICDRSLTGTFASDHFGVLADIATTTRITPSSSSGTQIS
jgi:endonuclease/exonuclease/phosphatase family metal-dependent hydrolase